jgi:hypothetical protein
MSFEPSRFVGRNIRPPCKPCKPDLSFQNTIDSTNNNNKDTDHSLDKLSLFFADPASHPSTTQSPPRSPTPFPLLLSAPSNTGKRFGMTIHTPTIFDPPMRDRLGRIIFGFGFQDRSTPPLTARARFGNGISTLVDLTNFTSGNNLYFSMPSFFPCRPDKGISMTLFAQFASGTKSNCINNPVDSRKVETLQTEGTVQTFAVLENVIKNDDACPTFYFIFSWDFN